MTHPVKTYLNTYTKASPLAVFRIGFGLMMLASIIRFWYHGWIQTLYINPLLHFKYYGFEWVTAFGEHTYWLFIICGLSALFVALGLFYRLAIITFFLSFTYIELIDKTTYLNHYYCISVLSFILIFLPANAYFSVDNLRRKVSYTSIPKWTIDSIKFMLGIVYFYAGLAKLNSDWLLKAQPLKIWLPSKYDVPLIGKTLMHQEWFHYVMSWSGALYDLSIPFLLLYKPTRKFAFVLVVFFHVFTRVLFQIGMFPFVMIVSTLIFFEAGVHERIIQFIKRGLIGFKQFQFTITTVEKLPISKPQIASKIVAFVLILQLLIPWRYLLYPGELFWTEEGYRFSWRVMLVEKAGYANFKIVNGKTGDFFYVNNRDFLTSLQEKQMSFQPDFILEYAHFLGDFYKADVGDAIEVYVDNYVTLNGRLSERFVDPKVNLYNQTESFRHKTWILPFNDTIKGL